MGRENLKRAVKKACRIGRDTGIPTLPLKYQESEKNALWFCVFAGKHFSALTIEGVHEKVTDHIISVYGELNPLFTEFETGD